MLNPQESQMASQHQEEVFHGKLLLVIEIQMMTP